MCWFHSFPSHTQRLLFQKTERGKEAPAPCLAWGSGRGRRSCRRSGKVAGYCCLTCGREGVCEACPVPTRDSEPCHGQQLPILSCASRQNPLGMTTVSHRAPTLDCPSPINSLWCATWESSGHGGQTQQALCAWLVHIHRSRLDTGTAVGGHVGWELWVPRLGWEV